MVCPTIAHSRGVQFLISPDVIEKVWCPLYVYGVAVAFQELKKGANMPQIKKYN